MIGDNILHKIHLLLAYQLSDLILEVLAISSHLLRITVAWSRRDVVWRQQRLLSCLLCEVCVCWEGFNHTIMIKVQESSPSIMVTRNLLQTRRKQTAED